MTGEGGEFVVREPSQALRASSPRGGAKKELTCVSFVIMPDGRTVPADELTAEEHAQWQENMRRRLSENLSDYYTQHPELYARL